MSRIDQGRPAAATPSALQEAEPGRIHRWLRASSRSDRIVGAVLALGVVANVVYLGALLVPGDPARGLVDVWLADIAEGLPVVVSWLVTVRTRFRRADVLLAAAALTCNLAGDVSYGLAMDASGYLPSPSVADVGYLLFYPLLAAAFIVTVLRRSERGAKGVAVDVALAALGSASVLTVVLGPVLTDAFAGSSALDDLIASLYPLFDVVLVALVAGVAASPTLRVGPRAPFLVAGLLLFTAADVIYALQDRVGAYAAGTPLDAAWVVAVLCVGVWVVGAAGDRPVSSGVARVGVMRPIPALAVIAGLAVLLIATQTPVSPLALVLAGSTMALASVPVLLRQAYLARSLAAREQLVERLLAVDKAKDDMIATVNHEMRTPLTSISGYLELVLDEEGGPIPAPAQDMLRAAQKGASRLNALVSDMMATTRLDARNGSALTPVRLDDVLRRSVELLVPASDARRVAVDLDAPEPLTIEGDREQLERALSNVIENAVKFSPASGRVRVLLRRDAAPSGAPIAVVSVVDAGMGIPLEEQHSLFDRFFRASNARSAAVPGSGLGLAISHGIVHAHGGAISVESAEGVGTTVRIALPLSPASSAAPADGPADAAAASRGHRPVRREARSRAPLGS